MFNIRKRVGAAALAAAVVVPVSGIAMALPAEAAPRPVRYGTPCQGNSQDKSWGETVNWTLLLDYLNRCVYKKEVYTWKGRVSVTKPTVWKIEDNCSSYMQKRC